jgi:hypothetical protein
MAGLGVPAVCAQTLVKECSLDGDFDGFQNNQIFIFTDGTVYYQDDTKSSFRSVYRPDCKIFKEGNVLKLKVEGIDDMVEVKQAKASRVHIVSDFHGWQGAALFELDNGQIWKQDERGAVRMSERSPEAYIVETGWHYMLYVKGNSVRVRQLR